MSSRRAIMCVAVALGFAGVGMPPGRAQAQLPHATTLYVDGASRVGPCSDSRPTELVTPATPLCTIQRAVDLASGFTMISVQEGSYGRTIIEKKSGIMLSPTVPGTVTVEGVSILESSRIWVSNLKITTGGIFARQSDQLYIDSNDVSGGYIKSYANTNSRIVGNYVHDVEATQVPAGYGIGLFTYAKTPNVNIWVRRNRIERTPASGIKTVATRNLLVERNEVLDSIPPQGSGWHTNAMRIDGGIGLTIHANRFDRTAHGLMFEDRDVRDLVVAQNVITNVLYGYALQGAVGPNAYIVGNTMLSKYGIHLKDEPLDPTVATGAIIANNIIGFTDGWGKGALNPGATENHNLWIKRDPSKSYGAGDVFGTPQFDPQYRLMPTSPGFGAGYPPGTNMGALVDLWPRGDEDPPLPPPEFREVEVQPPKKTRRRRLKVKLSVRCSGRRAIVRVRGRDASRVKSAVFRVRGRRTADRRKPFSKRLKVRGAKVIQVRVVSKDGRERMLRARAPRCGR